MSQPHDGAPNPDESARLGAHAAVLVFASAVASARDEPSVLAELAPLCRALFSPEGAVFVPIHDGAPRAPVPLGPGRAPLTTDLVELAAFTGRAAYAIDGRSLLARLAAPDVVGLLRLTRVARAPLGAGDLEALGLVADASALAIRRVRARASSALADEARCARDREIEARARALVDERDRAASSPDGPRVLRGLLPICCQCKRIRDDAGEWRVLEEYLTRHTEATFTHGICPTCVELCYPDSDPCAP